MATQFYRKEGDRTVYEDPYFAKPIADEARLRSLGGIPDWGGDAPRTNILTIPKNAEMNYESVNDYPAGIAPRTLDGLSGGQSATFERAPQNNSYSIFNNALMEMLKSYQTMGTRPAQEQALDLSTQQAQRGMEQATPGMSPGQQSAVRSASQSALTPSIQGAQDRAQTFGEQLSGFKGVLQQTQAMGQALQDQQFKIQENARKMVNDSITQFGSQAFEGVNEQELAQVEKEAGLPKGYLLRTAKTLKEQELAQKQQELAQKNTTKKLDTSVVEMNGKKVLINNQTGEIIKDYGTTANQSNDAVQALQTKVDIINSFIKPNSTGDGFEVKDPRLEYITGTGITARANFSLHASIGDSADLINKIQQLTSKESLDSLINAKKAGATFGALTDREMEILAGAATTLATAAVRGLDGRVIGYNMSKESFIEEMGRLKTLIDKGLSTSGTTNDDPLGLGFNQGGGGTPTASKIASAIRTVESGGNYEARGKSGEYGAYQFMPSSWAGWAKQYLGNANAPMTKENQDKVAIAKIDDLLKQGYTAEQIALIWNGGSPTKKAGVNKYGVKYDTGAYARKVLNHLG